MRYDGTTGKLVIGLVLVLVVGLVAAACGGDDEELAAPAPAAPAAPAATAAAVAAMAEEPEEPGAAAAAVAAPTAAVPAAAVMALEDRGTLRIIHSSLWGGLEVLHPHSPAYWTPPDLLVYDRLINSNDQGVPGGELLTSWEVDGTLQKWTFNVRQDVTFSDGSPYTSADVDYTIRSLLDPETGSQIASTLNMIDVDAMETPDDNTIILNLRQGIIELPLLMKHRRIRVVPDGVSFNTLAATPNGTGPFTVGHLSLDGVSTFNSRDDYWQGIPGLAGVAVVKIVDKGAQIAALQADQVDGPIWDLPTARAAEFEGDPDFYILENPTGSFQNIAMIVTEPPFDDPLVRKALKELSDREEIIAVVLQGHGTVSCNNPVRPFDQYFLPTECPQNLELARELLAQAGYEDGLEIELATTGEHPFFLKIATVYKEQAAEAGITVNLRQVAYDGYWSDVWMVHPFAHSSWPFYFADQFMSEAFRCAAPWGEFFWCNDEFEAALDAARSEPDFDTRRGLYQRAQEIIIDDSGNLSFFFASQIRAMNSRVRGQQEWWYFEEVRWNDFYIEEP